MLWNYLRNAYTKYYLFPQVGRLHARAQIKNQVVVFLVVHKIYFFKIPP
jgi:hypothetical protein